MRGPGRGWTLAFALALAGAACGGSEGSDEAAVYRAPAQARAAWLLEPPVVAVGEVATLDLAVVAAPETALRPFELPTALDGLFVLEREPLEVAKEPARWVHHTRLRVRAVEVGRFQVPGGRLELESPEGGVRELSFEPLDVEVMSVLAGARRQSPWGVRLLAPARDGAAGTLGAFAAGAGLALLGVGVLLLARRRLAQRPGTDTDLEREVPPAWTLARGELADARAALSMDPRGALDQASRALRRYAVRRFGGDAHVRTTEELADAQPPFTLTTRWQAFVELLAALDAARFPPPETGGTEQESGGAAALLARVEAFVEETAPRDPTP